MAKVRGPRFNPGWLPVFHSSLKIFPSLSSCMPLGIDIYMYTYIVVVNKVSICLAFMIDVHVSGGVVLPCFSNCVSIIIMYMYMDLHAGIATYSYEELCNATDEKSSVMKLGRGGFGDVFMGRL